MRQFIEAALQSLQKELSNSREFVVDNGKLSFHFGHLTTKIDIREVTSDWGWSCRLAIKGWLPPDSPFAQGDSFSVQVISSSILQFNAAISSMEYQDGHRTGLQFTSFGPIKELIHGQDFAGSNSLSFLPHFAGNTCAASITSKTKDSQSHNGIELGSCDSER